MSLTGTKKSSLLGIKQKTYTVRVYEAEISYSDIIRVVVEANQLYGNNWAWTQETFYDFDEFLAKGISWLFFFKYEEDAARFMITYPSKFVSAPVQYMHD